MTNIRDAIESDLELLVALSEEKRIEYQGYNPFFWAKASDSEKHQLVYFRKLLNDKDISIRVATDKLNEIIGFVIISLITPPPVYKNDKKVCIVDDFCIAKSESWYGLGRNILNDVKMFAKENDCPLVIVVSGFKDTNKNYLLKEDDFEVASQWHVCKI